MDRIANFFTFAVISASVDLSLIAPEMVYIAPVRHRAARRAATVSARQFHQSGMATMKAIVLGLGLAVVLEAVIGLSLVPSPNGAQAHRDGGAG